VILSDRSIRDAVAEGRIRLEPFDPGSIQPSSVDVHLSTKFVIFDNHTWTTIDVKREQRGLTREVVCNADGSFILHPNEFVLGATVERLELADDLVARLEGKSSLGRLGLQVHSTAGFVDAGWKGHLTLELVNVATLPIILYAGMKVAQLSFLRMTTPADDPYGSPATHSKYQDQDGPTPSRYWQEYS
jgi:dCTP deaminase